jgi:hypothetical protein
MATIVEGTIVEVNRLNSSRNGNPRFSILVLRTDGNYERLDTKSDSMVNYDIENLYLVCHRIGAIIQFGLTRAGRIETATRIA